MARSGVLREDEGCSDSQIRSRERAQKNPAVAGPFASRELKLSADEVSNRATQFRKAIFSPLLLF
jgi:hypothetical protein